MKRLSGEEAVEMSHHAQLLRENPAWEYALADLRARLARERDKLPLGAIERAYITHFESAYARLEANVAALANAPQVEHINALRAKRARERG